MQISVPIHQVLLEHNHVYLAISSVLYGYAHVAIVDVNNCGRECMVGNT